MRKVDFYIDGDGAQNWNNTIILCSDEEEE